LIGALLGLVVGVAAGVGGLHLYYQSKARTARGLSAEIIDDARRQAETLIKDADLRAK
jgi:hypothetical protein